MMRKFTPLATRLAAGMLLAIGLDGLALAAVSPPGPAPLFSFGVIADVQYCDCDRSGTRHYRSSPQKLAACVEDLNRQDLAFVIQLGDLIDRDFASFDKVLPLYQGLKAPTYHVLGNHDFDVAEDQKRTVPAKLGLTRRHYSFRVQGWRFVVLNGNDVSFYAYPTNSARYQAAAAAHQQLKQAKAPGAQGYNGGIGERQLAWLKKTLERASQAGEQVMLFCHFPVWPRSSHVLWNDREVLNLVESFDCVAAYLNGHNHDGAYGERQGIHYLTVRGMVETADTTAYAVVEVYPDQLKVIGTGREPSRTLPLKPPPKNDVAQEANPTEKPPASRAADVQPSSN